MFQLLQPTSLSLNITFRNSHPRFPIELKLNLNISSYKESIRVPKYKSSLSPPPPPSMSFPLNITYQSCSLMYKQVGQYLFTMKNLNIFICDSVGPSSLKSTRFRCFDATFTWIHVKDALQHRHKIHVCRENGCAKAFESALTRERRQGETKSSILFYITQLAGGARIAFQQ